MKMYMGVASKAPRHMREPSQDPNSLEIGPPGSGESSDCRTGSTGDGQPMIEPQLKAAMFTVYKKMHLDVKVGMFRNQQMESNISQKCGNPIS
jgi:hypothetical protein